MYDFQVLLDKIQSFQHSWEIVDLFRDLGIHGTRNSSTSCPIAIYFQQTGGYAHFGTESGSVYENGYKKTGHSVACTPAMEAFIVGFDNGWYPELELKKG